MPQQARTKTDRGDYVVTSFQIPDRTTIKAGEKKDLTEGGEKTKKRRVGAFHLDDSEEEGEQGEAQTQEPAEVETAIEEKQPVVVAAPVQEK